MLHRFKVEKFIEKLNGINTTEEVDQAFAEVFALPAKKREEAADVLEKWIMSCHIDHFRAPIIKDGHEVFKQNVSNTLHVKKGGNIVHGTEAVLVVQKAAQIMFNIAELKGDKTDPLLKAYVDAVKKLTDAEYNSRQCLIKPACAVADAVDAMEKALLRKPNPLRAKIAPAPTTRSPL